MRMLRFFNRGLAALVLAAALVGPAAAQQAPAPSPELTALAREVVIGSGMSSSFDAVPISVAVSFKNTTTLTRPETAKDFDAVIAELQPFFSSKRSEMIDIATKIVLEKFTEPELKEINAFFQSPVGRKYVQTQPVLLDSVVDAMVTWGQEMEAALLAKIREEMKKKGHNL
jgi:hypothetical protein